MSNVNIKPYVAGDKDSVVKLLRLNTPTYFAAEEEEDLIYYLENELEYYYVVEYGGKLVGCGGINFSGNPKLAKISWDIFHPDHQGKGFGSKLLQFRIKKLKEFHGLETITVRTTQLVYKFYEKNGFELLEVKENYWAPGFDLYRMVYKEI